MIIKHTGTRYLKEYSHHLKNLQSSDKYTRFGTNVSDYTIDAIILSMLYNPEKHVMFTAKDSGKIVGFCHLAIDHGTTWELAVSVDSDRQGKGIADKLMGSAIEWAKMNGIESMFMHCISENKKIQHLAKKHNLRVTERAGSDITAKVHLPQATTVDRFKYFFDEKSETMKNILNLQMKLFTST